MEWKIAQGPEEAKRLLCPLEPQFVLPSVVARVLD